jgi:hypothetical protein
MEIATASSVNSEDDYVIVDDDEFVIRTRRATALHDMLAKAPKKGENDILITHKPNIIDALGKDWFDVRQGEAPIFKPEGVKYRLVARVDKEDWPRLAAAVRLMELIRCGCLQQRSSIE